MAAAEAVQLVISGASPRFRQLDTSSDDLYMVQFKKNPMYVAKEKGFRCMCKHKVAEITCLTRGYIHYRIEIVFFIEKLLITD